METELQFSTNSLIWHKKQQSSQDLLNTSNREQGRETNCLLKKEKRRLFQRRRLWGSSVTIHAAYLQKWSSEVESERSRGGYQRRLAARIWHFAAAAAVRTLFSVKYFKRFSPDSDSHVSVRLCPLSVCLTAVKLTIRAAGSLAFIGERCWCESSTCRRAPPVRSAHLGALCASWSARYSPFIHGFTMKEKDTQFIELKSKLVFWHYKH